ncbi:hypothetical protein T01_8618 [Trichinella spiralis]|uniref:Uncharacterized protein n=1 Tax=Trichinella spiralis TaxID=6334 RepID=A0A0V1BDI8_TRISP|nr:hypothetical protein T01_8618 [Trichinella spiralis]
MQFLPRAFVIQFLSLLIYFFNLSSVHHERKRKPIRNADVILHHMNSWTAQTAMSKSSWKLLIQ